MSVTEFPLLALSGHPRATTNVRFRGQSGQNLILTLDDSAANDPKRT